LPLIDGMNVCSGKLIPYSSFVMNVGPTVFESVNAKYATDDVILRLRLGMHALKLKLICNSVAQFTVPVY